MSLQNKVQLPIQIMDRVIQLKKSSLFCDLTAEELLPIAPILREVKVAPAQSVCRMGDEGDRMFLVVSGSLEVHAEDGVIVVAVPGDCVGEISMLDRGPRTANVTALEPSTLMEISHEDFVDLLGLYPRLAARVVEILVSRMSA
jgi:CRP-like cAMP-binding protein